MCACSYPWRSGYAMAGEIPWRTNLSTLAHIQQVWTAFGIMLGNIIGVAFGGLPDSINWRLMLGSTVVLPVIVMAQVYFCPESPRWLIQKNKIDKAYKSFRRIRNTDVQAARDTYYTYVGVQIEKKINKNKNIFQQFADLFLVPRNRRAALATVSIPSPPLDVDEEVLTRRSYQWIVMFGQQFCGGLSLSSPSFNSSS